METFWDFIRYEWYTVPQRPLLDHDDIYTLIKSVSQCNAFSSLHSMHGILDPISILYPFCKVCLVVAVNLQGWCVLS